MVDDDVRLADIDEAVLVWCESLHALLDHGDFFRGHDLRRLLAEVDPSVRVLIDLIAFGDRIDEIAIGFGGEPVLGLASLGPADVEVVGVPIAIHVGHGHGGTSIQPSGWSHSSVTRFTDFMNAPGQAAIRAIDRLLWNAPGPTCFIWNTSTRSGGESPHGCNWSRRVTEVGKYSGRDGRGGSLLTAMIWSHSVIPGSCLYADPIRHSWSSTVANRSKKAFKRSTSLITPTTWKCNSSTFSGNLGPNHPSLSFTSNRNLG